MAFYIIYKSDDGSVVGWKKGNNQPFLNDGELFIEYDEQAPEWNGKGQKIVDGLLIDDPDYVEVIDERPIRNERNRRLLATDWTQIPDNGLSEEKRAAWRVYRQELRNLPDHPNWPDLQDDDWPNTPN